MVRLTRLSLLSLGALLLAALTIVAPLGRPAVTARAGELDCPEFPHPSDFVSKVDNRYLPLRPGTTYIYRGFEDGERQVDVVRVTHQRKEILGVSAVVVLDIVMTPEGDLIEKTYDWFAQDRDGNVWYLGEASADYEDGEVVSTDGSWEAGVDGARAGIIMLADPGRGEEYKQECAPGVAEDTARVLGNVPATTVPLGTFRKVLVTEEWNPLDPGPVEHKYYAPGLGLIRTKMVAGGEAEFVLVYVHRGARSAEAAE
jgi:hypothetical protein